MHIIDLGADVGWLRARIRELEAALEIAETARARAAVQLDVIRKALDWDGEA